MNNFIKRVYASHFMSLEPEKEKIQASVANYSDFAKIDVRCGTIISVDDFPEAHKPAYKIVIDFGSQIGQKRSSVQITQNYKKDELIGRQVIGVVNFPPKKIGPFISEVLTLGVADERDNCVLLSPDKHARVGARMY